MKLSHGSAVTPIKLATGLRPNSAGILYTLLLGIEAIGFPTLGLLLYKGLMALSCGAQTSTHAVNQGGKGRGFPWQPA